MPSLEDMVVKQKELINKGYQIDNITCAALMLIAERLKPEVVNEEVPMPKIGPLPTLELEPESTQEMIDRELEETDGND